jgi:peroxiredoxin
MRCGKSIFTYCLFFLFVLVAGAWGAGDASAQDELRRGRDAVEAGDFRQAIALLEGANKSQHKACGQCYLWMALAYRGLHDFERELENADKALEYLADAPAKARAHELKGDALVFFGTKDPRKFKDAEAEFRAAVECDGSNPVFHFDLGTLLLKEAKTDEGRKELTTFLESGASGPEAEMAKRWVADPRRGTASYAPDFQVTTADGESLQLSQLAGKVVVLDFWATWCPSCRAGVGDLQELVKKYPRDQMVLISISADRDEGQWRAFIAKKHMQWAHYRDSDRRLLELFHIHAFPTYLVIDKEGIIRQSLVGTNPQASMAYRLKPILKTLLESKAGS